MKVSNSRIIIFVKNAIPGKVKTRLAKTIGNEKALEVYLKLLEITKKEVLPLDAEKQVWYAWEKAENDLWPSGEFEKRAQVDGDLGDKMKDAFNKSFEEGVEKVILIGSDCPTLSTQILKKGFAALDESDSVFGPSKDGGYYLIGMNSYYPELLDNISWSTGEVMSQTELQARRNNIGLTKLPVLNDIDNEDDWNEYLDAI